MNKTIIVFGMHRSGTSAVAGLLNHSGIFMGDRLLGADSGNTKGYFEDMATLDINKKILIDKGMTWRKVRDTPIDTTIPVINKHIASLVTRYNREHATWGIKDPRLCITFPLWYPYLKKNDLYAILVRRDPTAIAKSLMKRNKIQPDESVIMTKTYVDCALDNINRYNLSSISFSYEQLLYDTATIFNDLEEFLQIKITQKASDSIDREMEHFK